MEGQVIERVNRFFIEKIVREFSKDIPKSLEFNYIRTDKGGREIHIYKLDPSDFGLFSKMTQNAKIILKIKKFKKEGKELINFDFTYEFFTNNSSRQGFPAIYYIYDVEKDSFKEYKS